MLGWCRFGHSFSDHTLTHLKHIDLHTVLLGGAATEGELSGSPIPCPLTTIPRTIP